MPARPTLLKLYRTIQLTNAYNLQASTSPSKTTNVSQIISGDIHSRLICSHFYCSCSGVNYMNLFLSLAKQIWPYTQVLRSFLMAQKIGLELKTVNEIVP